MAGLHRLSFRPSRRMRRAALRFRRAAGGVAAVEFALILPLMLLLYLGSAETTQAVISSRKAAVASQAISDIVTQQYVSVSGVSGTNVVTDAMMGNLFNAAAMLMQPFSTANLNVDVAAVSFKQYNAAPADGTPIAKLYNPTTSTIGATPTAGAANAGYAAWVRWVVAPASLPSGSSTLTSTAALARACTNSAASGSHSPAPVALTPDATASDKPSATTLSTALYPTSAGNSIILTDLSYSYTPTFGATIAKFNWSQSTSSPLTTTNTMFNTPRDPSWSTTSCTGATSSDHWICYSSASTTVAASCAYN